MILQALFEESLNEKWFTKEVIPSIEEWYRDQHSKNRFVLFHAGPYLFNKFDNSKLSKENNLGYHFARDYNLLSHILKAKFSEERGYFYLYSVDVWGMNFFPSIEDTEDHNEFYLDDYLIFRYNNLREYLSITWRNRIEEVMDEVRSIDQHRNASEFTEQVNIRLSMKYDVGFAKKAIIESGYHGYKYRNEFENEGVDDTLSYVIFRDFSKDINILDTLTISSDGVTRS